MKFVEV